MALWCDEGGRNVRMLEKLVRRLDENCRRLSRQIYSLIQFAVRDHLRNKCYCIWPHLTERRKVVEGAGFEPAKAEPSDLQSDPFGRSGTPPMQRR